MTLPLSYDLPKADMVDCIIRGLSEKVSTPSAFGRDKMLPRTLLLPLQQHKHYYGITDDSLTTRLDLHPCVASLMEGARPELVLQGEVPHCR